MNNTEPRPSSQTSHAIGPLAGVRVLDLSRVLAGPWATQTLGDLGADVIKVERPGAGDDTRAWGPPFYNAADGGRGDAAYFMCANRNKRSVCVDLATPEGQAQVRALAADADILVENHKAGGLARYGLDWDSLRTVNPRLVYCSITGFGQTGPYAARAGYDFMIQAMGGMMSLTGQPDGAPGAEPMRAGVAIADIFTGMYAATSILAALHHARATGQGQHLDVALFDCQVAVLANQAANYFATGRSPGRLGNAHPNLAPYQVFATMDGAMVLAVGNDAQFRTFCEVAPAPALAADARFETNAGRVTHRADMVPLVAAVVAMRTTDAWIELLEAAGVPCGPINDLARVFADPNTAARGLVVEMDRGEGLDPVRGVRFPVVFSHTPARVRSGPPALAAEDGAIAWSD
jgi:formyl-CoA transferase